VTKTLDELLADIRGKGVDSHGGEEIDVRSVVEDLIEYLRENEQAKLVKF
jgi:hypothetical protein